MCVYCGSSAGVRGEYAQAAVALGQVLAERGLGVVYGGGNIGLMGILARAALDAGGEVIGVIPESLRDRGLAQTGLSELRVVQTMHERKALMADLSDGFIALPGGLGTLEEFFEIVTWSQLGLHVKPCGLLNAAGYFDGLVGFLDHAVAEGFIDPSHRKLFVVESGPEVMLDLLTTFRRPEVDKVRWVRGGEAALE